MKNVAHIGVPEVRDNIACTPLAPLGAMARCPYCETEVEFEAGDMEESDDGALSLTEEKRFVQCASCDLSFEVTGGIQTVAEDDL